MTALTDDAAAAAWRAGRGGRWRRRYGLAAFGTVLVLLWVLIALAAPLIAPHRFDAVDVTIRLMPPSAEHWLGTDALGRDVFSRLLWGSRISLFAGIVVVAIGSALGVVIGGAISDRASRGCRRRGS